MSNVAPEAANLRAWLILASGRQFTLRIALSNGQVREGRLMGILDDCLMLAPVAPSRQPSIVALAHIVTIDVIAEAK